MALLTTNDGLRLDKSNPEFERVSAWQGTPVVICYAVTADASGAALQTIATPFGFEILDVIVQCRAANGSGTLILHHNTTAITDAIACVTDKALARAASIDDAQSQILAGDTLTVTANGSGDRGLVTIIGKRL
jgi:hypothetical protein